MLTKRNLVTTHATQEVSDHHPSHTHTHKHIHTNTHTCTLKKQTHTHKHMDTNHNRCVEVPTAVAVLNQDLGVS